MAKGIGKNFSTLGVVGPAKHPVHDGGVGKQVGNSSEMGITLHIVKENWEATIQVLLYTSDVQIWVNFHIGLQQEPFRSEPFQRATQINLRFPYSFRCHDLTPIDQLVRFALRSGNVCDQGTGERM